MTLGQIDVDVLVWSYLAVLAFQHVTKSTETYNWHERTPPADAYWREQDAFWAKVDALKKGDDARR